MYSFTTLVLILLIDNNVSFGQKYWLVYTGQPMNWDEAEAFCLRQYNTHLASIHSEDDNNEIESKCNSGDSWANGYLCWIGLRNIGDIKTDGIFEWTDGTDIDYLNWANTSKQQPNFSGDCVLMTTKHEGAPWNDRSCAGTLNKFICNAPSQTSETSATTTETPQTSETSLTDLGQILCMTGVTNDKYNIFNNEWKAISFGNIYDYINKHNEMPTITTDLNCFDINNDWSPCVYHLEAPNGDNYYFGRFYYWNFEIFRIGSGDVYQKKLATDFYGEIEDGNGDFTAGDADGNIQFINIFYGECF